MVKAHKRKLQKQPFADKGPVAPPAKEMANFELMYQVGHGGFGKVFLARNHTNQQLVAIKAIDKPQIQKPEDEKKMQQLKDEVNVHRTLHFPFICQMHQCFENGSKVYLVMEFCQSGNLHDVIENDFKGKWNEMPDEEEIKFYVSEIVCALEYLHENNILYRDLKAENIMVDKFGHLKLTDFGQCKPNFTKSMTTRSSCGTEGCRAPEIGGDYGRPVDIWALGALVYYMVTNNYLTLIRKNGPAKLPVVIKHATTKRAISRDLQNFIKALLTFKPEARPDISAVMNLRFLARDSEDWVRVVQKAQIPPVVPEFDDDVDWFSIFGYWGEPVDEPEPAVDYNVLFAGFEFNGDGNDAEVVVQELEVTQENEHAVKKEKKDDADK